MNRTLLDRVCSMLSDAGLPESYWLEALQYAALFHNVLPTRTLDCATPEEAWSGNKPDVSRLRVFGSRAFVHVPDKSRDKLGSKSLVCSFLGFAPQRRAFRVVHRPSGRFLESRDVIFDEGGSSSAPRYERITLEYDSPDSGGAPAGPPKEPPISQPGSQSESEGEIEDLLTDDPPAPAPAPVPRTRTPAPIPTPSIAASCPHCNIRAPACDDDPHYAVTLYGP
jgi:hypothetical protein